MSAELAGFELEDDQDEDACSGCLPPFYVLHDESTEVGWAQPTPLLSGLSHPRGSHMPQLAVDGIT